MPNTTPTAAEVAEAVRLKAALHRKQATLTKRKAHLEQSIADLPDDTDASDAQWFGDELKHTEAQLTAITNRLTEIEAAAKAKEIAESSEQRLALVALYEEARATATLSTMPAALRERVMKAVREDNERQLYGAD